MGSPWSQWYHRNKHTDVYKLRERSRRLSKITSIDAYIRGLKLQKGCEACGYNKCAAALCFHHRDPSKKIFQISERCKSWRALRREIAKCDVMCLNCHAELHEAEGYSNGVVMEDVPGQLKMFGD